MAAELRTGVDDVVVGVARLAWMYGRSRNWAARLLHEWFEQQRRGGPVRVFQQGARGSLFTTMAILHQHMPPGRDIALYKRMKEVEEDVKNAHQRIDREVSDRRRTQQALEQRVRSLESRRSPT